MCTSLTLKTENGYNILARTMDFAIKLNEEVHLIPRNYNFISDIDKKPLKVKYASVGMGMLIDNHPILADGVNEKGLTCATLYFPGFADFENGLSENKTNIVAYDLVAYLLSQFADINDVKANMSNVEILSKNISVLGVTPPLHWILCDKSSKCIVIEKTINGLQIIDNPIGVMTNSPNLEWHLNNLRQYIGLNPKQLSPAKWQDLDLSPFGQGSGTFGLPGDFTPPSRFVRASYLKNNILNVKTETDGVTAAFHILSECNIPKGAVIKQDDSVDYTIYTSAMCSESGSYYYHNYENRQISAVHLFNENLDSDKVKVFPNCNSQCINNLN